MEYKQTDTNFFECGTDGLASTKHGKIRQCSEKQFNRVTDHQGSYIAKQWRVVKAENDFKIQTPTKNSANTQSEEWTYCRNFNNWQIAVQDGRGSAKL